MEENVQKLLIELELQENPEFAERVKLLKELKKEVATLKEENKRLAASGKEYSVEAERNNQQIRNLNKTVREQNKEVATTIELSKSKVGSLVELRASLRQMVKAYDELGKAERESASGQELQKTIAQTTKELAAAEVATGRHQRLVGSYAEALKVTEMNLREMQAELKDLRTMNFSGMNPEEVTKVKDRMATLTDGISDFKVQIKTASADTIPAMVNGLNGLVSVSQLVVGSLSLMGGESESMKKLEKTMVQLIGVSQALSQIYLMLEKRTLQVAFAKTKNVAITIAQAVATTAVSAATWVAVAAQNAWKIAIVAFNATIYNIPVLGWLLAILGAIIFAVIALRKHLGALGDAFGSMFRWMTGATQKAEELKQETEAQSAATIKMMQAEMKMRQVRAEAQKQMSREIELMKARGDSIDAIKRKERELMQLKIIAAQKDVKIAAMAAGQYKAFEGIHKARVEALEQLQHEYDVFHQSEIKRLTDEAQKEQEEQDKKHAKLAEDRKKANEQYDADLKQLSRERELARMSETDAEIAQIKDKYQKFIDAAKELNKSTTELERLRAEEIKQITDKQGKEAIEVEQKKQEEIAKAKDEQRKKELEALEMQKQLSLWDIQGVKDAAAKKYQIERDFIAGKLALAEAGTLEEIQLKIQLAEFDAAYHQKELDQIQKTKEARIEAFGQYADFSMNMLGQLSAVADNLDKAEMEKFNKSNTAKQAVLKKRYDAGLMTEQQYEAQREQLEAQRDKREKQAARKAAVRQRVLANFQNVVDTAKGVMSVLSTGGGTSYSDFGISAGILSAMVIGTGIAQAAVINSAPLPEAESGMLAGRRHSSGGIPIMAEDGEAVINRRSTSMFLPELSAINQAGGGVDFGGSRSIMPTAEDIAAAIRQMPMYVAVKEVNDVGKKIQAIETRGNG